MDAGRSVTTDSTWGPSGTRGCRACETAGPLAPSQGAGIGSRSEGPEDGDDTRACASTTAPREGGSRRSREREGSPDRRHGREQGAGSASGARVPCRTTGIIRRSGSPDDERSKELDGSRGRRSRPWRARRDSRGLPADHVVGAGAPTAEGGRAAGDGMKLESAAPKVRRFTGFASAATRNRKERVWGVDREGRSGGHRQDARG